MHGSLRKGQTGGVTPQDTLSLADRLFAAIEAGARTFHVRLEDDLAAALQATRDGVVAATIVIPEDYSRSVARRMQPKLEGMRHAHLVKTGDRAFCLVGEWDDMDRLAASRPEMIGLLDVTRDMLEDLGGGLGVTDPVSGDVVLEMR